MSTALFPSLSPSQFTVLATLWLNGPSESYNLHALLEKLGVASLSKSGLDAELRKLEKLGLATKSKEAYYRSYWRVDSFLGYRKLRALVAHELFPPLLAKIRKEKPAEGKNFHFFSLYGWDMDPRVRELTLAAVMGDTERYAKVRGLWEYGLDDRARNESKLWARLLLDEEDCPEELPDAFVNFAVRALLPLHFALGRPLETVERRALAALDVVLEDVEAAGALAGHFLWRGDRAHLELMSRKATDKGADSLSSAALLFLDGKVEEAAKRFQRALTALRQERDDKRAFWCGPLGLAHVLAAIKAKEGVAKIVHLVEDFEAACGHGKIPGRASIRRAMETLDNAYNRDCEPRPFSPGWDKEGLLTALAVAQLPFHCKRWDDVWKAADADAFLYRGREAMEAGHQLAAIHLLSAASLGGPLKQNETDYLRRAQTELGLAPLWKVYRQEELWLKALEELEQFAPAPRAAGGTEEAMVYWLVSLYEVDGGGYHVSSITPRLRKRGANGVWNKGRNIALSKLHAGEYDQFLSPADVPMKGGIVMDNSRYYGGSYTFSERAVSMLIDLPNVYEGHGASERPVRLVAGECCLRAEQCRGGHSLCLPFPRQLIAEGKLLMKESDGLYKLYTFSDEVKRLAALLAKHGDKQGRLFIPAAGEKRLAETMARLSGSVRVVGDLKAAGVEGVRQVEGQVKLRMLAQQSGEGLAFELLNQVLDEPELAVAPGAGARTSLLDFAAEKLSVTRDLKGEAAARDGLLAACPALAEWKVAGNRWDVAELPDALTVLSELHGAAALAQVEWPRGQAYHVGKSVDFSDFKFSLGFTASEWLAVEGHAKLDEELVAKLSELLKRLPESVGDFIPLDERRYLRVTTKMRRHLEELSAAATFDKDGLVAAPGALPLLIDALPQEAQRGFGDKWRVRVEAFERALALKPKIPKGLQCDLRPYQEEGFVWLSRLCEWGAGACLADDMGLGKTVQLLALLLARAAAGPSLVVAPASVCRNWAREAERFAPGLVFKTLDNGDRGEALKDLKKREVLVCSYGVLASEEELFADKQWNIVVLDEAQAIKNHQSKRAKAAKKLKAKFRAAATGTPLENNLTELWSLFDFINPGLLGTQAHFGRTFVEGAAAPSHALKKLVAPFILRRLKSQVLEELPPKTEITLSVTLSAPERHLYEAARRNALTALAADDGGGQINILAQLTKLRRACCHPSLAAPEAATMPGAKMELLMELVEELRAAGHRALVFSQYVDCLSIVRGLFDAQGVSYQYLDGSTPVPERMDRVDAFQHGEGEFFLISLKAGGLGLNLTAANYVILLDPWWNPAVENQAADRAHRFGQTQPVTIYRLVTDDTVEERVIELHARKRQLAEEILDGADRTKLSKDELLALFH